MLIPPESLQRDAVYIIGNIRNILFQLYGSRIHLFRFVQVVSKKKILCQLIGLAYILPVSGKRFQ